MVVLGMVVLGMVVVSAALLTVLVLSVIVGTGTHQRRDSRGRSSGIRVGLDPLNVRRIEAIMLVGVMIGVLVGNLPGHRRRRRRTPRYPGRCGYHRQAAQHAGVRGRGQRPGGRRRRGHLQVPRRVRLVRGGR